MIPFEIIEDHLQIRTQEDAACVRLAQCRGCIRIFNTKISLLAQRKLLTHRDVALCRPDIETTCLPLPIIPTPLIQSCRSPQQACVESFPHKR